MNDKTPEYQSILKQKDKDSPCFGLSKGDGFMSLRIEFRKKNTERISFAYGALNEVHLLKDVLTLQFADTEVVIKGLALGPIMDALCFHQVLWLAEGYSSLEVPDGEPFIEAILLKKSQPNH